MAGRLPQQARELLRQRGPMAPVWRRRVAILGGALTIGTLMVGASTGREGPSVQVAASIMGYAHRLMAIPLRTSVFIAGGAAGVAGAFNTPLAGVAFAIGELPPPTNGA